MASGDDGRERFNTGNLLSGWMGTSVRLASQCRQRPQRWRRRTRIVAHGWKRRPAAAKPSAFARHEPMGVPRPLGGVERDLVRGTVRARYVRRRPIRGVRRLSEWSGLHGMRPQPAVSARPASPPPRSTSTICSCLPRSARKRRAFEDEDCPAVREAMANGNRAEEVHAVGRSESPSGCSATRSGDCSNSIRRSIEPAATHGCVASCWTVALAVRIGDRRRPGRGPRGLGRSADTAGRRRSRGSPCSREQDPRRPVVGRRLRSP